MLGALKPCRWVMQTEPGIGARLAVHARREVPAAAGVQGAIAAPERPAE